MSQPLQAPRGTRDLFGKEKERFDAVVSLAKHTADIAGFRPIATPTFEYLDLFQRSIGEGTDVIDKELFTLASRTGEDAKYALRPEGTAGIVRSFLEHGVQQFGTLPVKLVSFVNNFRYDRPQAGRYREHTQWDLEIFCTQENATKELAYVAHTTWRLFEQIGLRDVVLMVNNLGSAYEQEQYTKALQTFLREHKDSLTPDSQRRTEVNPMRVLDSKDTEDQKIVALAPKLKDFTEKSSATDFALFLELLDAYEVPYKVTENLVRGLDYYEGPVFEWVGTRAGQQSSLGGGGRYDRLLEQLGSRTEYGAVGAGIGIDRVLLEAANQGITLEEAGERIAVIVLGGETTENTRFVREVLSNVPYSCDFAIGRTNLGKELEKAGRNGATYALILGDTERGANTLIIRNLTTGDQVIAPRESLENGLPELLEV